MIENLWMAMIGGFVGGVAASAFKDVWARWPRGLSGNVNPNPPPAGPPPVVQTRPKLAALVRDGGPKGPPPIDRVPACPPAPPPPKWCRCEKCGGRTP